MTKVEKSALFPLQGDRGQIHVLLTGASGTVGSEVLAQLLDRDDISLTVFDLKTSEII